MTTFADVTKQVHLINDLILSDMICESDSPLAATSNFSLHLLATKNWFSRVSWANKKRYLLALLEDVRSAWALSLLLKSLWNCRPKDAVYSVNETNIWSSYDQVPMDHNRTALPVTILARVMKNDRLWFLGLDPEPQAKVLSELLIVAGGPIMWTVFYRAQLIYERHRSDQLKNLHERIVLNDASHMGEKTAQSTPDKGKKDTTGHKSSSVLSETAKQAHVGQAQKELEANLAAWNAKIKSMKDSLKLEEIEMRFKDGTMQKIWKVNRPKPEVLETVDFIQLLPSSIGKMIISYLPRAQLGDYARVNKYWAFLVDEFKAELTARAKINLDLDKLRENMLRHDTSLELIEQIDIPRPPLSSQGNPSEGISQRYKQAPASMKPSEKSAGVLSIRKFLSDNNKRKNRLTLPIRNLSEMSERLERRGAADENLWSWCRSVLKEVETKQGEQITFSEEGVFQLGNIHFPCPLLKKCLEVPLRNPLNKDPAITVPLKPRRNISDATALHVPRLQDFKRYSLWTRDLSSLYHVFKIPSYQSPI